MRQTTNFEDVLLFTDRFTVPRAKKPGLPDLETFAFRFGHLAEELNELATAYHSGDLDGYADALVDLVYVALGTAAMSGLPWQQLWDEVQRANMTKVRASADGLDSKRGSSLDVVKPEGWRAPDHSRALSGADQCPKCAREVDGCSETFCRCGVLLARNDAGFWKAAGFEDGGDS